MARQHRIADRPVHVGRDLDVLRGDACAWRSIVNIGRVIARRVIAGHCGGPGLIGERPILGHAIGVNRLVCVRGIPNTGRADTGGVGDRGLVGGPAILDIGRRSRVEGHGLVDGRGLLERGRAGRVEDHGLVGVRVRIDTGAGASCVEGRARIDACRRRVVAGRSGEQLRHRHTHAAREEELVPGVRDHAQPADELQRLLHRTRRGAAGGHRLRRGSVGIGRGGVGTRWLVAVLARRRVAGVSRVARRGVAVDGAARLACSRR
ncbi:MAG: hypothetical protein H0T76_16680 [Nannocystis sp.]|nr:hypothetical protein [Nannocystis sp.]MBA3548119.1 hypothetical protein [Nannocystis sp.]